MILMMMMMMSYLNDRYIKLDVFVIKSRVSVQLSDDDDDDDDDVIP